MGGGSESVDQEVRGDGGLLRNIFVVVFNSSGSLHHGHHQHVDGLLIVPAVFRRLQISPVFASDWDFLHHFDWLDSLLNHSLSHYGVVHIMQMSQVGNWELMATEWLIQITEESEVNIAEGRNIGRHSQIVPGLTPLETIIDHPVVFFFFEENQDEEVFSRDRQWARSYAHFLTKW